MILKFLFRFRRAYRDMKRLAELRRRLRTAILSHERHLVAKTDTSVIWRLMAYRDIQSFLDSKP